MDVVYLASPYSDPAIAVREMRYAQVTKAAGYLMARGFLVFSPITHGHPIATRCHNIPTDIEFWKALDRAMMGACNRLFVLELPGYEASAGVEYELELASQMGLSVTMLDPIDVDGWPKGNK